MADELELELEEQEQSSKSEKRIKDLSEKVKLTSEERDEKDKLLQEQAKQLESVQKEADFFKNFNTLSAKYPGATEFQDAIKEKVMSGYDYEDATVSVLNKEGKLSQETATVPVNPAGGSAATALPSDGEKPIGEMSQAERMEELSKREGDLINILRPSNPFK